MRHLALWLFIPLAVSCAGSVRESPSGTHPSSRAPNRGVKSGLEDNDLVRRASANGKDKVTRDDAGRVTAIDFTGKGLWGKSVDIHDSDWPILASMTSLRSLDLGMTNTGDEQLTHIRNLTRLRHLGLGGTRVTGMIVRKTARGIERVDSLKSLETLTHLKSLYLINGAFSGQGLEHLSRMKKLQMLASSIESQLFYDTRAAQPLQYLANLPGLVELTLVGDRLHEAGLAHLAELPQLRKLSLSGKGITDEQLAFLAKLTNLEELDLEGSLDGSFIEFLGNHPKLRRLHVSGCNFTDEGLAYLGALESLQELQLNSCRLPSDADFFSRLRGMKDLRTLNLLLTNVPTKGIEALTACERLTKLWLGGDAFGDDDLTRIAGLTRLKVLYIGEGITDVGLVHLAGMKHLEELGLAGNKGITDAGIEHLARLKTLKKVITLDTSITDAGRALLAEKIPGVEVSSSMFDDDF